MNDARSRSCCPEACRSARSPGSRSEIREPSAARRACKGKHGKLPKSSAEILRFARQPEVPFTNNRSEHDIAMTKARQKVIGTFQSPQCAAIRLTLQGRDLELLDMTE
ncbi:MAG: transposase [Gammaproteobacteria bacterium]|nr:transposase [Gammaproteobacteria bacterium]MCY4227203.1 transposase [Gammaproteobacteria bacterium]